MIAPPAVRYLAVTVFLTFKSPLDCFVGLKSTSRSLAALPSSTHVSRKLSLPFPRKVSCQFIRPLESFTS